MPLSSFLRARLPRSRAFTARPDPMLHSDLARLLTTAAPGPELFTQALELISPRAHYAACTIVRLARSATNVCPPQLVPYVTYPRHPLDRPEQPSRAFELTLAPWHRRAIETGEPVVVRQDRPAQRMDAAERAILGWDAFHAVCLVPLVVEENVLGVLACCETYPWSRAPLTPERVRVLASAGRLLALAMARLQAQQDAQRHSAEFQWLNATLMALDAVSDVDGRLRLALEEVCAHFLPTQAIIYLLQPELGAASGWAGSADADPHRLTGEERARLQADGAADRVLTTGETICETRPPNKDASAATTVTLPLKTGEQVLGTLQVTRPNPDAFDPIDVQTLEVVAGHLGAGTASLKAEAVIRASTSSLRTLQRLGREITTSLDVDEVCRAIYRVAREEIDCDVFYIALCDDRGGEVDYALRVDKGELLPPLREPLQDSLLRQVLEGKRAVLVPDVEQETLLSVRRWDGQSQTRALACVPMQVSEHVRGAISAQSRRPDAYTAADLEILGALAGQAAVAIDNAQLFVESQRKMRQLSALNEIGRLVTSTIEIDRLLELIYGEVQRILRADSYYVALFDSTEQALMMEICVDGGERFPRVRIPPDQGFANIVLQRRAPLLIRDLEREHAALPLPRFPIGQPRLPQSWLGVPMITSTHPLGVLAVASYEKEAFDESDCEVLQNIASQAAIAVDNARHHAQVEEQARRDSLTQALNHGTVLVELRQAVEQAARLGAPLSLIMLDIDHFTAYNDRYGHLSGDAILRGMMTVIRQNIRANDLVGRWGGEEFVIVLTSTGPEGARAAAGRIRQTLAEMRLQDDNGRPIPVPTVSQGIAALPEGGGEPVGLIDLADRRLYIAKARGRDQVEG